MPKEEKKHVRMEVKALGGDDEAMALIAATLVRISRPIQGFKSGAMRYVGFYAVCFVCGMVLCGIVLSRYGDNEAVSFIAATLWKVISGIIGLSGLRS